MNKRELSAPPLKESIFQIRWNGSMLPENTRKDGQLLAGIMLDKLKNDYPYHEPLEISKMAFPEDMVEGIAQHRFRIDKDKWPLVQIGSGVFTVNTSTQNGIYDWNDFKSRCLGGFKVLVESYPITEAIESISLKYINAIPFDFENENVFEFLRYKMNVSISLPENMAQDANLDGNPVNFSCIFNYPSINPHGVLQISLQSGKSNDMDSLVFVITFETKKEFLPSLPDALESWIEGCHLNIEAIFFKLIEKLGDVIK